MSRDFVHRRQCFFLPAAQACRDLHWCPSADIQRTPAGWLLKFDLAGVRPEDIEITVAGRRLTVRGQRRDWSVEEGHSYYRMEIAYSQFERSLELPDEIDPDRIRTEHRYGMLLLWIEGEGDT